MAVWIGQEAAERLGLRWIHEKTFTFAHVSTGPTTQQYLDYNGGLFTILVVKEISFPFIFVVTLFGTVSESFTSKEEASEWLVSKYKQIVN